MTNIIKKISQGRAILEINANAKYSIINDDIDNMEWLDGTTPISKADIEAKIDLKASAKAKLIAGEALTEDEANTIVL